MVKGKQFNAWRTVGLAAQAVRIHAMRGVDEVCLLDVGATEAGVGPNLWLVQELANELFVPLAVGGGIRNLEDAKALLRAGADKVVIGTGSSRLIEDVAGYIGSQAVVAAVDYRVSDNFALVRNGTLATGWTAAALAMKYEEDGAGEILFTCIDREGMLAGYDLPAIRALASSLSIPLIAHGGAGTYQHMLEAIEAGADAVAAGSIFQFTDQTPRGAARYLTEHGIEARV